MPEATRFARFSPFHCIGYKIDIDPVTLRAYTRFMKPSKCHCTNLRTAANRITRFYDDALEDTGLKVTQFRLLRLIADLDHPCLGTLQDETGLDRSTLGRNIRVLEKAGYVQIGTGADARKTLTEPTPAGLSALEMARERWQTCQSRVEDALGTDLHERLQFILHALDKLPDDQANH